MTKLVKPGRRIGSVTVPSSKSLAHRELIAAALSGAAMPIIRGESKDTLATRNCLKAMMSGESIWPCGESGTTLRLLEPIAGVKGRKGFFKCEGRLGERPHLPFKKQDRYVIPGNVSSQFVSGLLMALPLADWDSEIVIEGELQSASYILLTEDVLSAAGIQFERLPMTSFEGKVINPLSWRIRGRQCYRIAGGREVEGDWSQAACFLAMGVEARGLNAASHQGDREIIEFLERIDSGPRGVVIDVRNTPDLYPILAAYAAAKDRVVNFVGTERLCWKESDRLISTAEMIAAVRSGEKVDCHNDHRIAMAAAVMATYAKRPILIEGAECVEKSYPQFWADFESLSSEESR